METPTKSKPSPASGIQDTATDKVMVETEDGGDGGVVPMDLGDGDTSPTPKVLSQEEKAAEAKVKKMKAINTRIESLTVELAAVKEKLAGITAELKNPAEVTVKDHIRLLHEYNEIKDIGQALLGMIAGNRGLRIIDVYDEFGVEFND